MYGASVVKMYSHQIASNATVGNILACCAYCVASKILSRLALGITDSLNGVQD